MWVFSKQLTEYSVTKVLFWLAICGQHSCGWPNIGLFYGLHNWTETLLGFGARTIAVIDAATASPFRATQHDPSADADRVLRARRGHSRRHGSRSWASFMNLALVAGQFADKISQSDLRRRSGLVWRARPASDHRRKLSDSLFRSARPSALFGRRV